MMTKKYLLVFYIVFFAIAVMLLSESVSAWTGFGHRHAYYPPSNTGFVSGPTGISASYHSAAYGVYMGGNYPHYYHMSGANIRDWRRPLRQQYASRYRNQYNSYFSSYKQGDYRPESWY